MPTDSASRSPFDPFLDRNGVVILDGGLGSQLEAHGADLGDSLWSARVLLDDPGMLVRIHREFLDAGADCIATCTYQATLAGLTSRGLSAGKALEVIADAVHLALSVRDDWWTTCSDPARIRPLVAASIGPYGAYLADGAEYTGDYDIDPRDLRSFHESRWHQLAQSHADILALETMPSMPELEVLMQLLEETPGRWAWVSLSCRDPRRLADGTGLSDVVRMLDGVEAVAAIGVNCFAPDMAIDLIKSLREHTSRPVAVYPNSGERYDATRKSWDAGSRTGAVEHACTGWRDAGASVLGGCCRIGPDTIRAMRTALLGG